MTFSYDVLKNIEKYRKAKGMTLKDICTKLNMTTSEYYIETQKHKSWKIDDLYSVSQNLNISIEYLLGLTDIPTPINKLHKSIEDKFRDVSENPAYKAKKSDFTNAEQPEVVADEISIKNIEMLKCQIDSLFEINNDHLQHEIIEQKDKELVESIERRTKILSCWRKKLQTQMGDKKMNDEELSKKINVDLRIVKRYIYTESDPEKIKMDILMKIINGLDITFTTLNKESPLTNEYLVKSLSQRYEKLTPDKKKMFKKFMNYLITKDIPAIKMPAKIESDKKIFSERLRFLRKNTYSIETQKCLSEKISEIGRKYENTEKPWLTFKCCEKTVRNMESGECDAVKMKYVMAIAQIWDVPIEYLIGINDYNMNMSEFNRFCHQYAELSEKNKKIIKSFLETS